MSSRPLVCLVLGAALLAGCSGSESTLDEAQLPRLVLQPDDLGEEYEQFDEGRLAIADRPPGPRSDPGRFGRVDGWKARYRSVDASGPTAGEVLESRADLFAEGNGAHSDLAAQRDELASRSSGGGELSARQGLGDEAFLLTRPPLPGGRARFVTVAWRYANVTASVLLTTARADPTAAAMRLARLQQGRMKAAEENSHPPG